MVVLAAPGASLGYLPRPVATVLAPVLDGDGVVGVATLLAEARGAGAVRVRVTLTGAGAADAAAAVRAVAAATDTAPGVSARSALTDVIEAALTHDGHLWRSDETTALHSLRALPPTAAAFYLSLYRSADTARWHRPAKWDGAAGVAAAAALVGAGLAWPARGDDVGAAASALAAPELRAALVAAGIPPPPSTVRKAELVVAAVTAAASRPRARAPRWLVPWPAPRHTPPRLLTPWL